MNGTPVAKTSIRDMAPWLVLLLMIPAALSAKTMNADPAVFQLLSTIAGICGGALMPRRPTDAQTTTVTAGDPPTVTTGPTT